MLRRLSKKDLAGGAQASCMLEARIDNSIRFGDGLFRGQPPTSRAAQHLEGRSAFEAFVECVQPGKGPALSTAAVAAALLIASGQRSRKLACDFCQIPEGGARSRVGTLAKQMKQFCGDSLPELPEEWTPPPAPAVVPVKPAKPRRLEGRLMAMPQNVELLAKHHRKDKVIESSALSPQRTRRVHVLQHHTPDGGCELSTYATPFEETKNARCRRLGTNRERRRQAHKVRSTPHPHALTPTFALTATLTHNHRCSRSKLAYAMHLSTASRLTVPRRSPSFHQSDRRGCKRSSGGGHNSWTTTWTCWLSSQTLSVQDPTSTRFVLTAGGNLNLLWPTTSA